MGHSLDLSCFWMSSSLTLTQIFEFFLALPLPVGVLQVFHPFIVSGPVCLPSQLEGDLLRWQCVSDMQKEGVINWNLSSLQFKPHSQSNGIWRWRLRKVYWSSMMGSPSLKKDWTGHHSVHEDTRRLLWAKKQDLTRNQAEFQATVWLWPGSSMKVQVLGVTDHQQTHADVPSDGSARNVWPGVIWHPRHWPRRKKLKEDRLLWWVLLLARR